MGSRFKVLSSKFKIKISKYKTEISSLGGSFHIKIFFFCFLSFILVPSFVTSSQPLKPEKAFSFQARLLKADQIEIRFQIAQGYFLYRDKFKFAIEPKQIKLGSPQFPPGQVKEDQYFGRTEIFRRETAIKIPITPLTSKTEPITLGITYQGCSDAGLCYPPKTQKVQLGLHPVPQTSSLREIVNAGDRQKQSPSPSMGEDWEGGEFSLLFKKGNLFWIILSFFGFGLLLSFTPCVLPMVPIISGIIIAQGKDLSKKRAFSLSLTYVLGMAVTYSAAGVAAGFSGRLITAALQNPWVLTAFALIFVALALSMFGLYELQLPGFIQTKLIGISNRFKAGTFVGVFLMGLLSAVIVSPCVTAPLAGALLYISRTNDVWLGGSALFALALGMGVPLLIIGTSAGVLMPRAGAWMKWVKVFFGILLLAVALWIIYPLFSPPLTSSLPFQRVTSLNQLETQIKETRDLTVMLYVSADWCVSCREMEVLTFRDPRVKEKIKGVKLLKADVTQTNEETTALLRKFGLFGPPAVLFFDQKGREIPGTRVIGVQKAKEFLIIINKAVPR